MRTTKDNSVQFSINELLHIEEERKKAEEKRFLEETEAKAQAQKEKEEEKRRLEVEEAARIAAEKAKKLAKEKVQEERERLEIELAAQRAREEVEQQAAIERASLAAQKAGRPFDPNLIGVQKPKSNKTLIGGVSILSLALLGMIVFFATNIDDGVQILVPAPIVTITERVEVSKEVFVAMPEIGKKTPAERKTTKPQKSTPNKKPVETGKKPKNCGNDPLCGVKISTSDR